MKHKGWSCSVNAACLDCHQCGAAAWLRFRQCTGLPLLRSSAVRLTYAQQAPLRMPLASAAARPLPLAARAGCVLCA
jgi:hypothetical protein